MQDIAKTTLPGVDKAIELGIADPDRLRVIGTIYDGYSTLVLIVQTTRFKAAISHAGMVAKPIRTMPAHFAPTSV